MAQGIHGLTLPKINADSREEFDRSWKRFEVIAAANKWEGGRDLVILPALLRGKLLDIYMQLPDSDKADLATLKKALADRAGLTRDPLLSAKRFGERCQELRESVRDFEMALCKLFTEAYPDDDVKTASVLLGRFATGLRPELARQVLLCGTPTNLDDAVKDAIRVERAMGLDDEQRVQAVQTGGREDLREVLDKLVGRMEALELCLLEQKPGGTQQPRCYLCNKKGHIKCYCPSRRNNDDGTRGEQASEVCYCNSTSLRVQGMLGGQRVSFLVDLGAAVSVVSYDILPPSARSSMNGTPPLTIRANGIPLDVLGIVNVMVELENIKVHHDVVVARKLTVECLLGMDFLSRHGAVIDCSNCKLTLAVRDEGKARHEGREHERGTVLVVNLVQTTKIPARSQVLVRGRMGSLGDTKGEGLIEPAVNIQRGILVARSV